MADDGSWPEIRCREDVSDAEEVSPLFLVAPDHVYGNDGAAPHTEVKMRFGTPLTGGTVVRWSCSYALPAKGHVVVEPADGTATFFADANVPLPDVRCNMNRHFVCDDDRSGPSEWMAVATMTTLVDMFDPRPPHPYARMRSSLYMLAPYATRYRRCSLR